MNKNAKLWVKALRSGKYKQAQRQLKDGDAYCCLGVACVLAAKSGIKVPQITDEDKELEHDFCIVRDWLGLKGSEGNYQARSLAADNDEGKSFEDIADIIEAKREVVTQFGTGPDMLLLLKHRGTLPRRGDVQRGLRCYKSHLRGYHCRLLNYFDHTDNQGLVSINGIRGFSRECLDYTEQG